MDNNSEKSVLNDLIIRSATLYDLDFIVNANNIINDNSNLKRADKALR